MLVLQRGAQFVAGTAARGEVGTCGLGDSRRRQVESSTAASGTSVHTIAVVRCQAGSHFNRQA